MLILLAGIVLFFGMHSISIMALPLRDRLAARNRLGYRAIYSLVSLIGLLLIIKGYGQYRLEAPVLYVPPIWLRHVAALLILPAFILFIAPYLPSRINMVIKHPQVLSVKIWATAHLLVNGSVADLILFGSFLAWAVVDRISLKRRPVREVPHLPASKLNLVLVIIIGVIAYGLFASWLHGVLIGVKPFGR